MSASTGVHVALREGDLILLDRVNGRYHCVPGTWGRFQFTPSRMIDVPSDELAEELEDAGLLVEGMIGEPVRALHHTARRDLKDEALPTPAPGELFHFAMACLQALIDYRGRGFEHIVSSGRKRDATRVNSDTSAEVGRGALVFRRLLPYVPFQGACLFRSFLLRRFLRLRGFEPQWWFGVVAWPMEAHCWLQWGDLVIDDAKDRILLHTPIMRLDGGSDG